MSRKDLVIEWRPIYSLYLRMHNINDYSPILVPELVEIFHIISLPLSKKNYKLNLNNKGALSPRPLHHSYHLLVSILMLHQQKKCWKSGDH